MKNKTLINLIAMIFFGMLALTVFAEDKAKAEKKAIDDKDEIVLQDGKVLKKPYIISRTPTGLNVGHESGVIFIPFSEMSEKRQKQYNYNPEKAKAYKKRIAQAQQRRKERIVQANQKKSDNGFFAYEEESFPEQSTGTQLENELASLLKRQAQLKREYSQVSAGRVTPQSGHSDGAYFSYRGGKVYRKTRKSYTEKETKNFMDKRRRLKEINGEMQKVSRRINTVRNLIQREKVKGIKVGRTLR
jgi:hypothetical protein